jgi:type II secretory pathway component PulF
MGLLSSEIETKAMVPVCRQLATTYEAGIPIIRAFEHVGRESKDAKVKQVCEAIATDLRSGATLGDATRKQSKYLSPFFVQLLANGERGGHLDVMLEDLAGYFEDRLAIQRSVRAALAYPVTLGVIAWFLGTFAIGMGRRAVAAFSDPSQGGVSGVEAYFREWAQFQAGALAVFLMLAAVFVVLSRQGVLGWLTGAITTHVWPLSRVTRYFAMARFFRSLSLLLGSGLSVVPSIRGAAGVTANPYIERDLLTAIPRVQAGGTLVEAFAPSRYITPMAREMLSVAEESGQLDMHLKKCADYHLKEATQATRIAVSVFTTLLMLGVFGAVGGVIIMFYVNLYGGMMDALGI